MLHHRQCRGGRGRHLRDHRDARVPLRIRPRHPPGTAAFLRPRVDDEVLEVLDHLAVFVKRQRAPGVAKHPFERKRREIRGFDVPVGDHRDGGHGADVGQPVVDFVLPFGGVHVPQQGGEHVGAEHAAATDTEIPLAVLHIHTRCHTSVSKNWMRQEVVVGGTWPRHPRQAQTRTLPATSTGIGYGM